MGARPGAGGDSEGEWRGRVFESHYDEVRGAVTCIRSRNGGIGRGEKVRVMRADTVHEVIERGQFVPHQRPCGQLMAGQVGYVICNLDGSVAACIQVDIERQVGNVIAAGEPAQGRV